MQVSRASVRDWFIPYAEVIGRRVDSGARDEAPRLLVDRCPGERQTLARDKSCHVRHGVPGTLALDKAKLGS